MKRVLQAISLALLLLLLVGATGFYLHPLWFATEQTHLRLWHAGVQSKYVEVDGYRLHYLEAIPPPGTPDRPILLIHGLGARSENWAPLLPILAAQGLHVYAPDLLGYGRSPQPDVDYSIALEETLMADFLATLHISNAEVAGWSMGGWIAMRLAADHPTLVRRLILADSAGIYFPPTFDATLFSPVDSAGLTHLMAVLSPYPRAVPPFVARDILRLLQGNAWVIQRAMTAMSAGRDLMDFRLGDLRQPTLILWGREDELIPLEVGERIHHLIPQSHLTVLDGCGHLAPSECYRSTAVAILAFLHADPPPKGGEDHLPSR